MGAKPHKKKTKEKAKTLDPYRKPGSPIKSGTSVEDDKKCLPPHDPNQRLYETGGTGKINVDVLPRFTYSPERLMKISFPLPSKTKD